LRIYRRLQPVQIATAMLKRRHQENNAQQRNK